MSTQEASVRMCDRHEYQLSALRSLNHVWHDEQEARWVTDMVRQCLACQGRPQPVVHLSRQMDETPAEPWPTISHHVQPMSRQKRRMRAAQKRTVGRRRVVRLSPTR